MKERLQIHKKADSSASAPVRSFQSRPFTDLAQPHSHKPLTQTKIENQELQQHKFKAKRLEIQAKHGTITPEGQEQLTVLQAKMNDLLHRRVEHASRFGHNFAKIAINRFDASLAQPIQPKLTIREPQESLQEPFIDQRFPPRLETKPLSMKGSLPTSKTLVQPKLTIGQPGDKYEQEADRVAAQVVIDTLRPKSAEIPCL